ncbi:NAD(+)/NADH kinase [Candidatus Bathyarchaeota archaeon]|nr:NAD(+)/NADH kinase [Candidatus Bathyarchaeota archaeon]
MRVGLISRTDSTEALEAAKNIIELLKRKKFDLFVETETSMALDLYHLNQDIGDMDVDFIISIGGDGTILRAAMGLKNPETPILGINFGRRGFLCEINKEEIEESIEKIIRKDYRIEESLKLSSKNFDTGEQFPDALNEVLISSSLPSKMLVTKISVNDVDITEIQSDGVIIATPTGSTAYNLSAGGSILTPNLDAMIITAICPYSYFKSIAFPINVKIYVKLMKPKTDGLAIIDGKVYSALKPMSTIEILVSKNKTRFIRFKPFYQRLKNRLAHLQTQ